MKKTYHLVDLDCAHCAAKMETAIGKIEGVTFARVSFLKAALTLEAPEDIFEEILRQAQKIIKKIEPDCKIEGAL